MHSSVPWAARYNTWLLIKLTPKGVVFSFLFFSQLGPGDELDYTELHQQARATNKPCTNRSDVLVTIL